ncbi:MAG: hypothetical protein JNM59_10280 [Hyphomonadaceae bacterium]|nr:hypothetical protein [Hyphomonadaceae bacterium]
MLLLQTLVYFAALAGIVAGAFGLIYFVGGALNRARPRALRLRRAVFAALCLCGIVASATLGFVGIAAILYYASS